MLRPVNKTLLILILVISALFLEAASIVRWVTYPALPSTIFGDWSWSATYLESSLFYALGRLSPYIMLALLFSFLLRKVIISKFKDLVAPKLTGAKSFGLALNLCRPTNLLGHSEIINALIKPNNRLFLAISLILTIVFAIYPYFSSINPENFLVGYDLHFYIDWVKQLQDSNAGNITAMVFNSFHKGDRPLTILFIYAIYSLTNLPIETVVQFFPLVLAPALVLVVYHFVKFATGNNGHLAGISALLTVVSYYFIVGMFAGFLANWLALITVFLSLLILLRTFEKPSLIGYALFAFTTLTTLFIHVYTWSYFITGMMLYLILSYVIFRKDRQKVQRIILLAMIVSVNILVDGIRTHYTESTGGIESTSTLASSGISLHNLSMLWQNLNYNFNYYLGGYFTNFVMLALAFIWTLSAKFARNFDRLMLSMLYIGVIPVLFGDSLIQARVFYNMPLQIPAAVVLYRLAGNNSSENTNGRFPRISSRLLFYAIVFSEVQNQKLPSSDL